MIDYDVLKFTLYSTFQRFNHLINSMVAIQKIRVDWTCRDLICGIERLNWYGLLKVLKIKGFGLWMKCGQIFA